MMNNLCTITGPRLLRKLDSKELRDFSESSIQNNNKGKIGLTGTLRSFMTIQKI